MDKIIQAVASICIFIGGASAQVNNIDFREGYKKDVFIDSQRHKSVQATAKHIHAMYQEFAKQNNIPGLAYGVVLDGQLVYANGIGFANKEQQITASSTSLFRVASLSKNFTTIAIFQLRDAKKLSLDEPISKYLPAMKNLKYLTSDSPEITIRHLLNHRSGLPKDGAWADLKLSDTNQQLQQLINAGISLSNVPGTATQYSNLGYALLGKVVEKVSGLPYAEYSQRYILNPLGMKTSVWEFTNADQQNLAMGYKWQDEQHKPLPLEHHGSFGAMGGLISSVEDFVRYAKLHLDSWPSSTPKNKVLKRSSIREMHVPGPIARISTTGTCPFVQTSRYGLGWRQSCDGIAHFFHHGGLPGFSSNWAMSPQYGLAVIGFSNLQSAMYKINHVAFKYIIDEAKLGYRQQQVSADLSRSQQALYELFTQQDQTHTKTEALEKVFAENLILDNKAKHLLEIAQEKIAKAGGIKKMTEITPIDQLSGRFLIEGEVEIIEVLIMLTPEQRPLIHTFKIKTKQMI